MVKYLITFIFVGIVLTVVSTQTSRTKRVAIVGAGIGGSSAAYYLTKFIPEKLDITVFEKRDRLGGRIEHKIILDVATELGADIFYVDNLFIKELMNELGLKNVSGGVGTIGIWDGKEFLFREGSSTIFNMMNALWRYGLSPIFLDGIVQDLTKLFMQQYSEDFQPWESIGEWLARIGLEEPFRMSTEDYLLKNGFSKVFINELVSGITKVIYQQEAVNLHALAGMIAIVGSGSELAQVQGGNRLIVDGLLNRVNPNLLKNTKVTKIERTSDSYIITYNSEEEKTLQFDAVILATPLGDISLVGPGLETPLPTPYVPVYVTVVVGSPDPKYFGVEKEVDLPSHIMVPFDSNLPWTVFSVQHISKDGEKIYKLFSPKSLEDILPSMFSSIKEKMQVVIDAYPYMPPNVTVAPIKLGPNFYYPSAFDTVITCMETSILSSRNSVKLLAKSWANTENAKTHTPPTQKENEEL